MKYVITAILIAFSQFAHAETFSDWPEGIMWFCKVLVTGPGTRLNTPPLTMQVLRVNTVSSSEPLKDKHE